MSEKPNVIWIVADQWRAQAVGINGDPNAVTPNIDRLATYGINFQNAVAGFPLCCPFRGSMLTGVYPHKCVPGHEYQMPMEQSTIATVFNENGYHTAYFGKWHLDGFKEKIGRSAMHIVPQERRGDFQYWLGYENNNNPWDSWVHGGNKGEEDVHYKLPGFETDVLTDKVINYIEKQGRAAREENEQPFFAVLSVQPPHTPYAAPEEYMKNYQPGKIELRKNVPTVPWVVKQARRELAGYYAMIENFDANIGRIMKTLEEQGLDENTHIVIFSDHGDMHGAHGQFRKMSMYEEAMRIPFIIGGEKMRYSGRKIGSSPALVNHVDIAPTTLGLCGITPPDWMEGINYASHRLEQAEKTTNEPDSAFLQCIHPTGHPNSVNKAWRGIVTKDNWKYACFEGTPWLLYNLNDDPYEEVNLVHNNKFLKKRKELHEKLENWINETEDIFVLPQY